MGNSGGVHDEGLRVSDVGEEGEELEVFYETLDPLESALDAGGTSPTRPGDGPRDIQQPSARCELAARLVRTGSLCPQGKGRR